MRLLHVASTGRVANPPSPNPGRRPIVAPEAASFPAALGHAANLGEMSDASRQQGERSAAGRRAIAVATASTAAAPSDRTGTAAADHHTAPRQPLPPLPIDEPDAVLSGTVPGRDAATLSSKPEAASDRAGDRGGLSPEGGAAPAPKTSAHPSSGARQTERVRGLPPGVAGTAAGRLSLRNTVPPALRTPPEGTDTGREAASNPMPRKTAPTDRVDASAQSAHSRAARSNPTSDDGVPRDAIGPNTSTPTSTMASEPTTRSRSADRIESGQAAAGPILAEADPAIAAKPVGNGLADPTHPATNWADDAWSNPVRDDGVPRGAIGPPISTFNPTGDPGPISRSQSTAGTNLARSAAAPDSPETDPGTGVHGVDDGNADTAQPAADRAGDASANPESGDRVPQDAIGPPIPTADPTADPSQISRSVPADAITAGQPAVGPDSPESKPATATTVVGDGLAGATRPATNRAGDTVSGSSEARFAAAAASLAPMAAGASPGLPGEPPPAVAASLTLTDLPDQLFRHVVGSIGNPGSEVVLHLNPPELGDLTVRVLISGRAVSAWFGTPRVEVQQVISQALGTLQADLGNAGYTLGNAWVGADAFGTSERGGRGPRMPEQRANTEAEAEASPASVDPIRSFGSGVSVYV